MNLCYTSKHTVQRNHISLNIVITFLQRIVSHSLNPQQQDTDIVSQSRNTGQNQLSHDEGEEMGIMDLARAMELKFKDLEQYCELLQQSVKMLFSVVSNEQIREMERGNEKK